MKKFILPFAFLALCGCDEILDCAVINRRADMQDKPQQDLRRGEYTRIVYEAEVTNDTADDEDYSYDFDVDGVIPAGLTVQYAHRQVVVSGYPERAGTYDFRIRVYVDYTGFDRKCLNDDSDENSYRITVR